MDSSQAKSDKESEWNWEDSLLTAIQLGISVSEYDEMTPYELSLYAEVFSEKIEADQQEKLTIIWLGEYYHRVKKLPRLKDVLNKNEVKMPSVMSDDEMYKAVKILNQKLGGKVESS